MTKCYCYIFQFLCSLARYKERKRDETFKLLKIFQWVQALHLSLVRKSFINLNESPMSAASAEMLWKSVQTYLKEKTEDDLKQFYSQIYLDSFDYLEQWVFLTLLIVSNILYRYFKLFLIAGKIKIQSMSCHLKISLELLYPSLD